MQSVLAFTQASTARRAVTRSMLVLLMVSVTATGQSTVLFEDSFGAAGTKLNLSAWTTEVGPSSFLGQTQLADWVSPGSIGQFVVGAGGAQLALNTFNPTGISLYGTHGKTLMSFQPAANTAIVFTARLQLTSLQRGIVYGVYLYGCAAGASCGNQHDEIDIELVTNLLQPGAPLKVQLNRYANEPLGAGNGALVDLPPSFDPLAPHDWTIMWSPNRIDYSVDGVSLFSTTTHVPQGLMQANVIAWAPDNTWPTAYDASLQPAKTANQNQRFDALLSRVVVSSTTAPMVNSVGLSPAALRFAAVKAGAAGGLTAVTAGQTVTVTFSGASSAWTASANQPWVQITNGSGTGAGQFTASIVNPGNILAGATSLTATITVSAPTSSNASTTVPVTLTLDQSDRASAPPFGQVDTPVQNASGVVGAIGVTGWALDDVGVTGVKIYRNCLPFENQASCQTLGGVSVVFIGDAAFVAGARPDVESAFMTYPQAYRAGWGYLLLTNMLPHVPNRLGFGGQGPLTLYAFASDSVTANFGDGNVTLLGRTQADHTPTAITMANDTIAKPFGAIDTPGQGQTVSGTLANFGWVLTPDPGTGILMPPDGSTMSVYIDGVWVGTVAYNQCRGTVGNPVPVGVFCNDDVADIFGNATPQAALTSRTGNATKYRNLDAGRAAIGAFTIDTTTLSNGSHSLAWGVTDSAGRVEGIGSRNFVVLNSGEDAALGDQLRTLNFELRTSERTDTGQRAVDVLAATPAITRGLTSSLAGLPVATGPVWGRTGFDPVTARVTMPADASGVRHIGIPELGRLELTLPGPPREESELASAAARVSGGGAPRSVFDGFLVANGTLRDLPVGSHLDAAIGVFTWAPGPGYIGTYRLIFVNGGQQIPIDVTIRPAGMVDPTQGEVRMFIDTPGANELVHGQFTIAGWALDPQAAIGSGIDAVHVWAKPTKSTDPAGTPRFLGAATLDGARPDVAAAFGGQFDRTGYGLVTSLSAGEYDLIVYVHSARTGQWEDARAVRVTVR